MIKSLDPAKDNSISVSSDNLHGTNADRFAGSDRAGTAEKKEMKQRMKAMCDQVRLVAFHGTQHLAKIPLSA